MAVALCAKGDRKRFLVGLIVDVNFDHVVIHYFASPKDDEFGQYTQVIDPASQIKGKPWQGKFANKDVLLYFDELQSGKIPPAAVDGIKAGLWSDTGIS